MVIWLNLDNVRYGAVPLARVGPLETCGLLDAGHADGPHPSLYSRDECAFLFSRIGHNLYGA